jgi:hypothetical protein
MRPDHLEAPTPDGAAVPRASERLPLRSRNIGVLCDDPQRPEAHLLQQMAAGLGARVALVRSDLDATSGAAELSDTARVLARLYDAVLCVNLAPPIVAALREAADVPVIAYDVGEWLAQPPTASDAAARARALLLAHLAAL